jgi:Transcription factor Pcc1
MMVMMISLHLHGTFNTSKWCSSIPMRQSNPKYLSKQDLTQLRSSLTVTSGSWTACFMMEFPYTCEMEIVLPESRRTMATDLMRILSVDKEIGRVVRTFSVRPARKNALVIHFAAPEAKLLRVSVSSFTEYLNVALHCYQEFVPIPSTTSATTSTSTPTPTTAPMELKHVG